LGWLPTVGFDEGLLQTVNWYVENSKWWLPHIEKRLAK
jgi:dTDP-D-glucose 4,6-dehydratase